MNDEKFISINDYRNNFTETLTNFRGNGISSLIDHSPIAKSATHRFGQDFIEEEISEELKILNKSQKGPSSFLTP